MSVPEPLLYTAFRHDLLHWFDRHRRTMPWRDTRDPYLIWVAEVMLQQTRVDQVRPYFDRFITRFPDVHALAAASLDEVLKAWEGLGYYRRAHHLHAAARKIVEEHGGRIPRNPDTFASLPGVGPYTLAAVLSIAFGYPLAAVDGNVIRVLTRVFAVEEDVSRQATRNRIRVQAQHLMPEHRAGDFNQALMELGATVCTPRKPRCTCCPLHAVCLAAQAGTPTAYPVKQKRAPIPHVPVAVGILQNEEGCFLVTRRPTSAMLGGLWEFPGGKVEPDESPAEACVRELKEELGIEVVAEEALPPVQHTYSHFRITLHAFRCRLRSGQPVPRDGRPMRWATAEELARLAFPRANRKLIDMLLNTCKTETLP